MPDLKVRRSIWNGITKAAEKQGRKPEALANRALQEFLDRLDDTELLARSQAAAKRAPLAAKDTEQAIRSFRQRQKS